MKHLGFDPEPIQPLYRPSRSSWPVIGAAGRLSEQLSRANLRLVSLFWSLYTRHVPLSLHSVEGLARSLLSVPLLETHQLAPQQSC